MPAPSVPIDEALAWLRDHTRLTEAEYQDLVATLPTAYRVFGDLPYVIERGEVDVRLVKKLAQVLNV